MNDHSTIRGPTILLYSGTYFNFERPADTPVTLKDVARGLSQVCRFAGQCPRFYSVAEHSVLVSRIVPAELAWQGLMHDAAEAFIGDVAKPLKVLLPDYAVIERRVEAAIAEQFLLPAQKAPQIKEADIQMLRLEQAQMFRNDDDWEWTFGLRAPAGLTIEGLLPDAAMDTFLCRAAELRPGLFGLGEPECLTAPDGRHQVDTSMESGSNNCFHCEKPMNPGRQQ